MSSFIHQRHSYFSGSGAQQFSLSPSAGHREDSSVPIILYRSNMDLYKGHLRGPGFLPYLTPFHHHDHFGVYECTFEPAFIQKRNERERQRVKCVNQGYAKLREHLPGQNNNKRLSKVETLRATIRYIKYLQGLVEAEDGGHSGRCSPESPGAGEGQRA